MKISEYVNQGLKDAFPKKISPRPNCFPLAEPYLGWKKLVLRANSVFNIQGEAKKIKNRACMFNFDLNVYIMTDFIKFNKI